MIKLIKLIAFLLWAPVAFCTYIHVAVDPRILTWVQALGFVGLFYLLIIPLIAEMFIAEYKAWRGRR